MDPLAPSSDAAATAAPTAIDRRTFLGWVVKGSGVAVAVKFGAAGLGPAAQADGVLDDLGVDELLDLSFPELADTVDLTDLLLLSGEPFYHDYLIKITPDNRVDFELPRMEVGQGILTTAAMIVAEELDARVDQVDASLSPAELRRNTGQITGGSHATTSLWDPLRKVSATLRAIVVDAAAAHFGVPANEITTRDMVAYASDGRSVPYADLHDGISGPRPLDRLATPKDPTSHRIIGRPHGRIDAHDIVTGMVDYAMDMDVVEGALPTVVARPPTLGGRVVSYDDTVARSLPGVVDIAEVDTDVEGASSGVAVVARTIGEAFRARDALDIQWSAGVADDLSDDDIIAQLRAINLPTLPGVPLLTKSVSGEFIFPYMAHAPMETMTAVADVSDGRARIWTGAKTPLAAQAKIARDLGMLPTNVELNVIKSGGSFGRRLFFDAAVEAARISDQLGRPIKLMFSRQDDTKFGRARPLSMHHVQATHTAGLLGGGDVLSFDHRCATPELDLRHGFGEALTALGAEVVPYGYSQTVWHTTQLVPYAFGATSLLLNEKKFPVPTSSWRSIYSGTAAVANEVMVDELARAMGHDELAFRLDRLDDDRSKAVLAKVADEGNWGRRMGSGHAQGLGLHAEYKSRAAFLVEINTNGAEPRVTKVVAAVDVNRVVNPTGLEGQVISGTMDAIASVIRAGLHLDNGAIRESSYGDFLIPRMRHSPPEFEVHFMPNNGDRPGGAGELCVPAASAAIANAFARATGIKPRRFPLVEHHHGA